jgi:hemimethylated DNA binding protein
MTDENRLPHLLKLLDDDSPTVRQAVAEALAGFGEGLDPALDSLAEPATPVQRRQIDALLLARRGERLLARWPEWFALSSDDEKLEQAFALLEEFRTGGPSTLAGRLDALAEEYRAAAGAPAPTSLARFLFKVKGLKGARDNYLDPLNSDLAAVIERGEGLPISLCLVYRLVGRRVGVEVESIGFPGHFLARVADEGQEYLVDCFAGGRFATEESILEDNEDREQAVLGILRTPLRAEAIVLRALNNLARAYLEYERPAERQLVEALRERLAESERALIGEEAGDPESGFQVGELVRHRRYGYRGVIVARDESCQASADWYWSNRTQPDRHQPWYHVLVHGDEQVTYAAQSSLIEDDSGDPVQHRLLPYFFERFDGGGYIRNDRPWPRRP